MKMDTVREASSVTVRKTAYCDNHAPPDSERVCHACRMLWYWYVHVHFWFKFAIDIYCLGRWSVVTQAKAKAN